MENRVGRSSIAICTLRPSAERLGARKLAWGFRIAWKAERTITLHVSAGQNHVDLVDNWNEVCHLSMRPAKGIVSAWMQEQAKGLGALYTALQ